MSRTISTTNNFITASIIAPASGDPVTADSLLPLVQAVSNNAAHFLAFVPTGSLESATWSGDLSFNSGSKFELKAGAQIVYSGLSAGPGDHGTSVLQSWISESYGPIIAWDAYSSQTTSRYWTFHSGSFNWSNTPGTTMKITMRPHTTHKLFVSGVYNLDITSGYITFSDATGEYSAAEFVYAGSGQTYITSAYLNP